MPVKDAKYSTHQDVNTQNICPSHMGAKNISPAAYSLKTHLLYVPLNLTCMSDEPVSQQYIPGKPWAGTTVTHHTWKNNFVETGSGFGAIAAINALTGKVVWQNNERFTLWSGAISTSSNLVFYSTLDRWFKAVDAKTGRELWRFQLGSGSVANPFTFSNKGKQYVGIYSGLGGWVAHAINMAYCDHTCGSLWSLGDFYHIVNYNTKPGGGALNIFSL